MKHVFHALLRYEKWRQSESSKKKAAAYRLSLRRITKNL
jgi:hypothetical protein